MISFTPSLRIHVCLGSVDLRGSFDRLSAIVKSTLQADPLSGHLFVFRNRRGDRLKILVWDRSGFWVLYKRLEKGTFAWPETTDTGAMSVHAGDLALLLSGVDLSRTRKREWYERAA